MNFELEYNSERSKLIIPEYGRHIQKLVNHCKKIEDKKERTTMAQAIVNVMGNLQPHLRDVPDFKHKLWDQLFIMSNFELEVDSPYEKPEKEVLQSKPEPLKYPKSAKKYRFYGHNIQDMINVATTWEEGDAKEALYFVIANHMKKCYLNWNKDTVEDQVIFEHLKELSDGKIDLSVKGEELSEAKDLVKKKKNNKSNKNNRSKRRR